MDIAERGLTEALIKDCFLDRIKESGDYPIDVREWMLKEEADKTCENMKAHFL